ncbi:MAG: 30S ribosomal protein S16 [Chloroflexi bacterium HGW-Chloroflexi-9]|nr:30S ribosomal protein S16 [Dehalococcoidia bacterium]PKN81678.1 MAG: 30S ribosomal protein S16 [Chloroflexi bacterium HGW-Chloroflexi-9]
MLKIRLRRTGQKHQPSYRVVVADKDAPRDGKFIEILGHYNPRTEPVTFEVKADRVQHWIGVGAQPSDTVHRLLHQRGIVTSEPPKRDTKPTKAEREAAEAAVKAAIEEKKAAEAAAKAAAEEAAKAEAEAAKAAAEAATAEGAAS